MFLNCDLMSVSLYSVSTRSTLHKVQFRASDCLVQKLAFWMYYYKWIESSVFY